ncbi:MAG: hypothetical protein ACKO8Q_03520 [Bacteroidota bacterium]
MSRKLSKSHFNIRGFYQNSLNNFKYQDLLQINSPWFWQKHNNVNASGIALNWKRPGQKRILEANIFGVQRQMNLPSPMGGLSELLSSQFDQQVRASFRSLGKMKEIGRSRVAIFNWSLGSTLESQLYSAPTELSKINTQSNVLTGIYVNKGELVQAQTAVTYQNDFIEYANWDSKLFLNTVQLNQQLSLLKKNNLLLISIIPQWRNTNHKGLSTELQWSNRRSDLQHEITIFHRERFPDSNELFWQPGGNVNLKKEASSGVIWAEEFNFQSLNFHSYFKSGIIQNWIQWVPGTLGYWNPKNVKQVVFAQWRAVLKKSWSNVVVQCYGEPALSLGKNLKEQDWFQTTYSPLWRAGIVAQYKGNTWNAQLEFQTNGKRYTDEENTEVYALPAYGLLNSEVSKEVVWKGQSMLCLIRVENITNKQYSFIRAYAMPGRVLSFQINYHIK